MTRTVLVPALVLTILLACTAAVGILVAALPY